MEEMTFDYARGKKIWGDGLCGDQYFYRCLLDGDDSTLWKCRYPYIRPQYIIIDLEKLCVVNRLVIKEPENSKGELKEFSVNVSLCGEKWKKVNLIIKKDTDAIICDFAKTKFRFLRLELISFNEKALSLSAIEIYNTEDTEPFSVPLLPKQIPYNEEVAASKIVWEDEDGFLKYRPYDDMGNRIPDFSNVGYGGGGELPQNIDVKIVLEPQSSQQDDTKRIQAAIDEVSSLPVGKDGYRGAVLLKKGRYNVTQTININTSGVVLMGEGSGEHDTVINVNFGKKAPFVYICGKDDMTETENSRRRIVEDFIPVGCNTFTLEDTSGYSVGDDVVLHIKKNQKWVDTLKMGKEFLDEAHGKKPWDPDFYQYRYQSRVVSVSENTITLDQSVVDFCDRRYCDYEIYRYSFDGRISRCGVRDMRVVSAFDETKIQHHDLFGEFFEDNDHADIGVRIDYAEECWVKNFTTVHFANQCVCIWKMAKRITVEDCSFLKPVSTLVGGNRYAFSVNGQQNLVRNCYSEFGRHDFVTGAKTCGPNVFYKCTAENSYQNSENHHRWGTATLYDNVSVSGPNTYLSAGNRGDCASGHGWAGANMVFWNCTAPIIVVQKPPLAQNLAIGVSDILEHKKNMRPVLDAIDWYNQQGGTNMPYDGNTIWGDGYKEAVTNTVTPCSLWEKQYEDRQKRERSDENV